MLETNLSRNGSGFDYNAAIGEVLLVWIDSLHILHDENGIITSIETLRKHS